MGWNNSPPLFCTATETVADLANQDLSSHAPLRSHNLDDRVTEFFGAEAPTLDPTMFPLSRDPLLLHTNAQLLTYVEVFFDDLLGLVQGPTHWRHHLRRPLFHDLEKVPLDNLEPTQRKEILSLKKLDAGDFSWSTCQILLGWMVDTVNMTLRLPPHRSSRLKTKTSIPPHQGRVSVKNWHQVLGELRSMALSLPGARVLFIHMQESLLHVKVKRFTLTRGVHASLSDF